MTISSRMRGLTKRSREDTPPASRPGSGPADPAGANGHQRESYYVVAPPSKVKGRPMGWYSVDGDITDERFWDGRMWTRRRRLVDDVWAPAALETGEAETTPPREPQEVHRARWGA